MESGDVPVPVPAPGPTPIVIRVVQDPPPAPQMLDTPPPPPEPQGEKHDDFYKYWDRFLNEKPSGKSAKRVIRDAKSAGVVSLDSDPEGRPSHLTRRNTQGTVTTQKATSSYEEAAATCRAKVRAIVNECSRLNIKYTDRNFYLPYLDSLVSLDSLEDPPSSVKGLQGVGSTKRVGDIYEDPHFFVDGATANDVRQGSVGDCWFLAAITALSGKKDLIERICVDRDEKVGVYGFVFFRDGEWISEIVDDKLALRRSDDERQYPTEYLLSVSGDTDVYNKGILPDMQFTNNYDIIKLPKEFRESLRKGSNSLYFASCRDSNETWLPLLEKAYAKIHGDYQAIAGGFAGEGIEDLTGGVSTYITSETVLDRDKLWSELMQVNKESGFLFGCGSRIGRDNDPHDEEGFVRGHAYTVLNTREVKDPEDQSKTLRLLRIRNPWGRQEWNGAWSDGSKEWTAKMMQELDHKFGDDGIFWISFPDWLKYFPDFERTRLFGTDWTVTQQWTSANVPWNTDYLDVTFNFTLSKQSPVVLVLSQPDSRFFSGLQGRHRFRLHFRLYKNGEETYIVRSILQTGSGRSCSAELDLEPGDYFVHVKIDASRYDGDSTAEEVIKKFRFNRRDKLLAVGKNFDLPNSKGRLRERENKNAADDKATTRKEKKDDMKRDRIGNKKERDLKKARERRIEAEIKRKEEIKKAEKKKEKEAKEAKKAAEKAEKAKNKKEVDGKASKEKSADPPGSKDDKDTVGSAEAEMKEERHHGTSADTIVTPPKTEGSISSESTPQATPDTDKSSEQAESKTADEKATDEKAHEERTTVEIVVKSDGDVEVSEKKEERAEDEEEEEDDDEDDVSDVSSVIDDDFDWDSDIDAPADVDTEDEDEPGMYASDPWNAVCVIGLRVYSMDKDTRIHVKDDVKIT